jgi:hypothetical protein
MSIAAVAKGVGTGVAITAGIALLNHEVNKTNSMLRDTSSKFRSASEAQSNPQNRAWAERNSDKYESFANRQSKLVIPSILGTTALLGAGLFAQNRVKATGAGGIAARLAIMGVALLGASVTARPSLESTPTAGKAPVPAEWVSIK